MHTIHPLSHQDILDAEQVLEQAVWDALIAVCDTVADGIDNIVTAAAPTSPIPEDPKKAAEAMVHAAPGGKPGQPWVSVDDLVTIMPAWQQHVDAKLQPLVAEIYSRSGQHITSQLAATLGPGFDIPPVSSVFAEEYLAQAENRLDNIGNTVWERARGELVTGFQNGESIPQLAARVRSAAPLSARAATSAARTEIVSASNAGSIATARAAGVEMDKQWLATKDGRTRPSHRRADGQKVAISEAFTVGGYSLDFPGDPGGPPSETDNCRCTITFEIPDATVNATRIPAPATELVEPQVSTEETAAVARQALIDQRRTVATLSGEAQTLTRFTHWTPDQVATELRAIGRRAGADAAQVEQLAALAGDPAALTDAAQAMARAAGAEQQGIVGEVVRFDRTRHESMGVPLRDGDPVEIVRPGFTTQLPDREQVRLSKALVEETEEPLTEAQIRDMAKQVGLSPAVTDELVARIEERGVPETFRFPNAPGETAGPHVPVRPSTMQIRAELQAAKTATAVSDAFAAEAKRITGREVEANLSGSVATAREHAEGLLRGLERYPDANLVGARTLPMPADQANAYAIAYGTGRINFSLDWSAPTARKRYLQSLADSVQSGFHPVGTDNPMAVALHEFGHTLDLATLSKRIRPDLDKLLADRAAERDAQLAATQLLSPEDHVAGRGVEGLIRREISGYAMKDREELVAEAFSDVMMNGDAASALSHEIVDLVDREYAKGGFKLGEGSAASTAAPDLTRLTVPQLRQLANDRGVALPSRALKKDIIDLLRAGEVQPAAQVVPLAGRSVLDATAMPDDLTRAERAAMNRYGGDGGYVINADLRDHAGRLADLTDKNRATVQELDAIMARSELSQPAIVYRTISRTDGERLFGDLGFNSEAAPPDLTGKAWTEDSYTSTSVDARQPNYQAVRLRILVPTGTRGVSGALLDSDELLLDRGLTFQVVEDKGKTAVGLRELVVEVLPKRAAPEAAGLARKTVAELRTLAKDRGITIPAGAKKADILDLLSMTPEAQKAAAVTRADAFLTANTNPTPAQLRKEGITKVGTVSKTRTVAYDAKTYEVRGVEPAAGAKVRVVKPGYSITVRGETVVVRKPLVEAVEATGPAKSINDLLNMISPDPEQLRRDVQQAIEGEFGSSGLTVKVIRATTLPGEHLNFSGNIIDSAGKKVGQFSRMVGRDFRTGELHAEHVLLKLNRDVQGSGFAEDFNQSLYDWYRRSGVKSVEITANIDVGGYTWARAGYDFRSGTAARFFLADARAKVDKALARTPKGLTRDQVKALDQYLKDIASGKEVASAPRIAAFGREPGQGGRAALWPGKWLMLKSSWLGRLDL